MAALSNWEFQLWEILLSGHVSVARDPNSHLTQNEGGHLSGGPYNLSFLLVFMAPEVGLEPTTLRLTAECSAIELLRNLLTHDF
jgi:hypothetical protein